MILVVWNLRVGSEQMRQHARNHHLPPVANRNGQDIKVPTFPAPKGLREPEYMVASLKHDG